MNKTTRTASEDDLTRGSVGEAEPGWSSILGPATAMPLFAPCIAPPLFPIVPYHRVLRAGCIFAHPHPLYRGVSRRQRTAAAELAMPGRAPPGVSIEKLAAPPYPFLHLGADMAGRSRGRGQVTVQPERKT